MIRQVDNLQKRRIAVVVCSAIFLAGLSLHSPSFGEDPAADEAKVEKNKDESVQLKISRLLEKMSDGEKQKRAAFMAIVIDDVVRLSQLNEDQRARLEIAAKGATERSMESWFLQADRYVQGRMKGATKDTADQMLASVGNVSFGGREGEKQGETETLWKDTLTAVLNEKQVEDYAKVVEDRKRYSARAFGMVVMATLDEHLRLTPEQHSKLAPLAEESTREYLDEIRQYWGDYFEKSMLMSLLGGADEIKVKEILTDKQFDRWQGATSNFDHFWEQRRREKKKEAAEKKPKEEEAVDSKEEKQDQEES